MTVLTKVRYEPRQIPMDGFYKYGVFDTFTQDWVYKEDDWSLMADAIRRAAFYNAAYEKALSP